ncbi:MAG TPA: rod shape-determining protein MreC [Acidimicrobiales bacterium]|nr:rod shape-determining protein MreC [Acidimicrobiales bacterium]
MAVARVEGNRGRLAVLVMAAVTALVLDRRDVAVVDEARDAAASLFDPFDDAAEVVSAPLTDAWNGWTGNEDVDELREENQQLREQLASIEAGEVSNTDAAEQLAELTRSLELPWAGDLPKVTAQVTSGPRSNFSHAIEINKGSDQGIKVGMPAVTGGGLVGRVSQVSGGRATVELVSDPEFRVGVRLAGTGALGTARGQGRGEPLVVDASIEPGTDVAAGTGVVTSGVDRSLYPDAIPVGKVRTTREGAGGLSLELIVDPLVDVDRLSYVSILQWEPPA